MENYKDGELGLDKSKYPKDEEGKFTEEAINLFYYEKLGGQNHAKKKHEKPFKDQQQELEIILGLSYQELDYLP